MLASDYDEAIRLGREALTMAEEFGLGEMRAAALSDIGSSLVSTGDVERGLAEQAHAAEVAAAANAPYELLRAEGNLAARLWSEGRLAEGARRWEEAAVAARQYGQSTFVRWFRGVLLTNAYTLGRWDEALAGADAFIAAVESGSPHYLAPQAYTVRALIRLARDHSERVLDDAQQAVALARRAKDPQILFLTLAGAAHVHSEMGDQETAFELVDEYLTAIASGQQLAFAVSWVHVFAWTVNNAGRGQELTRLLADVGQVPWVRAARAFAEGDPQASAQICAEMGALTQEAYARLAAARGLAEERRRTEADEQLRRVLSFYRSVGAKRYVREGEALLPASA
jgi:tetratricopeptide (TPR) repeat protein